MSPRACYLLPLALLLACGKGTSDDSGPTGSTGVTAGTTTSTTSTQPLTWAVDVHGLLLADCGGCHEAGAGGYTIDADVAASYTQALARVNTGSPASSLLLTKATGTSHTGGAITGYGVGESEYNTVLIWIESGALE